MRYLCRRSLFVVIVNLALTGCVQIPAHDGAARVPLDHVVKLVKCDIYNTIRAKLLERRQIDPKDDRLNFLTQWAAKVHLTIIVDDTASLNLGATFIDPLKVSGTSFSVGAGAGVITEAVRQEDVEFFLSFTELGHEFDALRRSGQQAKYNNCPPADGILLESDLGLKPIFDMALKPVEDETLTRGKHPGLASSPSPGLSAASATLQAYISGLGGRPAPTENIQTFREKHSNQFEALILPGDAAQVAADSAQAEKIEQDAQNIIKNIVTPLNDVASSSLPKKCLADTSPTDLGITTLKGKAVVSASLVSVAKLAVDDAKKAAVSGPALDVEKARQKDTVNFALALVDKMKNCLAHPPRDDVPLYDPINLISETINFYITSSGSVTPTWKLVRVSAPLAPIFLSGSRKDTNTLIIAMGRPDTTNGKDAAPSAAMNQQVLASLLG